MEPVSEVQSDKQRVRWPVPPPYEDELLYSVLARMWAYMGRIPSATWYRNVCGGIQPKSSLAFHPQINRLSASLNAGPLFAPDTIIDNMTLFKYYSAFVSLEKAGSARIGMLSGDSSGHKILNGATIGKFALPRYLRFCPECLVDWRIRGEDYRWVRSFQLTSTLVCLRHSAILRQSKIPLAKAWNVALNPADPQTCPQDAPMVVECTNRAMLRRLMQLAIAGQSLLSQPPISKKPTEWCEFYHQQIEKAGLNPENGRYSANVAASLRGYWGDCLSLWKGSDDLEYNGQSAPWPVRLIRFRQSVSTPLPHLLMQGMLHSLPDKVEIPPWYGSGPWKCMSPVAPHKGQMCVNIVRKGRLRGRLTSMQFECTCGHVYSQRIGDDGLPILPRTVRWGHTVEAYIKEALDRGETLWSLARALKSGIDTVVELAASTGIDIERQCGWKVREKKVYRRRSISAKTYLLLDDNKVPSGPGPKASDWVSIEKSLLELLPCVQDQILKASPIQRVTKLTLTDKLSEILGPQEPHIGNNLAKMPRLLSCLKPLIETSHQWIDRRADDTIKQLLDGWDTMPLKDKTRLMYRPAVIDKWRALQTIDSGVRVSFRIRSIDLTRP